MSGPPVQPINNMNSLMQWISANPQAAANGQFPPISPEQSAAIQSQIEYVNGMVRYVQTALQGGTAIHQAQQLALQGAWPSSGRITYAGSPSTTPMMPRARIEEIGTSTSTPGQHSVPSNVASAFVTPQVNSHGGTQPAQAISSYVQASQARQTGNTHSSTSSLYSGTPNLYQNTQPYPRTTGGSLQSNQNMQRPLVITSPQGSGLAAVIPRNQPPAPYIYLPQITQPSVNIASHLTQSSYPANPQSWHMPYNSVLPGSHGGLQGGPSGTPAKTATSQTLPAQTSITTPSGLVPAINSSRTLPSQSPYTSETTVASARAQANAPPVQTHQTVESSGLNKTTHEPAVPGPSNHQEAVPSPTGASQSISRTAPPRSLLPPPSRGILQSSKTSDHALTATTSRAQTSKADPSLSSLSQSSLSVDFSKRVSEVLEQYVRGEGASQALSGAPSATVAAPTPATLSAVQSAQPPLHVAAAEGGISVAPKLPLGQHNTNREPVASTSGPPSGSTASKPPNTVTDHGRHVPTRSHFTQLPLFAAYPQIIPAQVASWPTPSYPQVPPPPPPQPQLPPANTIPASKEMLTPLHANKETLAQDILRALSPSKRKRDPEIGSDDPGQKGNKTRLMKVLYPTKQKTPPTASALPTSTSIVPQNFQQDVRQSDDQLSSRNDSTLPTASTGSTTIQKEPPTQSEATDLPSTRGDIVLPLPPLLPIPPGRTTNPPPPSTTPASIAASESTPPVTTPKDGPTEQPPETPKESVQDQVASSSHTFDLPLPGQLSEDIFRIGPIPKHTAYVLIPPYDHKGKKKAKPLASDGAIEIVGSALSGMQQQSRQRLRIRDCEWKGCNARLDSEEKLRRHLEFVHGNSLDQARYRCLWRGIECRQLFLDKTTFIEHLMKHGEPGVWCSYKDCDHTSYTRKDLSIHVATMHPTDQLRPLANPHRPQSTPSRVPTPPALPTYRMVPLSVSAHPMDAQEHEKIGTWVWRQTHGSVVTPTRQVKLASRMRRTLTPPPLPPSFLEEQYDFLGSPSEDRAPTFCDDLEGEAWEDTKE